MGHVYTPGLKATAKTLVKKRRQLPLKGDVKVKVGDIVRPDTVVAGTHLPGNVEAVNVANKLGCDADEVRMYLKIKEGVQFKKNDVYAENKGFFGWFKTQLRAPFDGSIESVSPITGQVILRAKPIPVELMAYISGKVTEIMPEEGCEVESVATFIQGIFGIGGEKFGEIVALAPDEKTHVTEDQITPAHRGKIVIAGSIITSRVFKKANELGVHGLVAGGIDDSDLKNILGEDIGVAITGSEDVNTTIVITEGFGEIPMARRTFELLTQNAGKEASINGATQIRAGVIRPEIVIAQQGQATTSTADEPIGLGIGSKLRVIRVPYFGMIGTVTGLPSELTVLESESKARVLEVEFEDGRKAIVPRANVEMIEE